MLPGFSYEFPRVLRRNALRRFRIEFDLSSTVNRSGAAERKRDARPIVPEESNLNVSRYRLSVDGAMEPRRRDRHSRCRAAGGEGQPGQLGMVLRLVPA